MAAELEEVNKMWVSKKKWRELEQRVAVLEKDVQERQPSACKCSVTVESLKNAFRESWNGNQRNCGKATF